MTSVGFEKRNHGGKFEAKGLALHLVFKKRPIFTLNAFKCLTQLCRPPSLLKRDPWLTNVDILGFKDAQIASTGLQLL